MGFCHFSSSGRTEPNVEAFRRSVSQRDFNAFCRDGVGLTSFPSSVIDECPAKKKGRGAKTNNFTLRMILFLSPHWLSNKKTSSDAPRSIQSRAGAREPNVDMDRLSYGTDGLT